MKDTEWLNKKISEAIEKYEDANSDAMSYQHAAEAETYNRIKKGTLMFGNPKEALETRKELLEDPDYGMSAARVRALQNYLEREP